IKTEEEYFDEDTYTEQNSKENEQDWQREQEILLIQDEREVSYEEAEEIYERQAEIEHNAFATGVENNISSTQSNKDYWIVEFNEGSNLIEKNYAGEVVTKKLLDEIKVLDEKIRVHNKTVGEDEYGEMTDEWVGYSKFYFDHIVDGKVEEHFRMDIGDGNEVNQRDFQYLYEQIEPEKENKEYGMDSIDSVIKDILEKESMTVVSSKDDYIKLFPYF
ncbi:TPA: hypothetical protein TT252_002025, partial [Streptococcus equi subsp. equi]|nr:hypothetical protein [Streptococcus equi subsp. equi]